MTRKISKLATKAFINNESFNLSNTSVEISIEGNRVLKLHNNIIAIYHKHTNLLYLTLAGWPTVTTRERLNTLLKGFGLFGYGFIQKKL